MKQIIFILAAIFLSVNVFSQAPVIEWQNTIGGSDIDIFWDLKQTTDSGYILCGHTRSGISGDIVENNNGDVDYWIVKIDSVGNIQWQNMIGGNLIDNARMIQQTTDGGYIIGGSSISNISGDKTEICQGNFDYWMVKIDVSGNIEWQKTIGGDNVDDLYSLEQTLDGGYILGGESRSNISGDKTENTNGDFDYWIVKTDSAGNIQWQNTIGSSGTDHLRALRQTLDGGYIIGGSSWSNATGDKTEGHFGRNDIWIVKVDSLGSITWQNTIGGNLDDVVTSIIQTSNGDFMIAGGSDSDSSADKTENSMGGSDYWILNLDATGNIQWQNVIGGTGPDGAYSIVQTFDGGFLVSGSSVSDISGDKTTICHGGNDFWTLKLDTAGNILWQLDIGGGLTDLLPSAQQTTDGGFILGGYSTSNISGEKTENCLGYYDYWIVKLSHDISTKINQLTINSELFSIYPNPTTGEFMVRSIDLPINRIEIYTTYGKEVFSQDVNSREINLNCNLNSGIYIMKILYEEHSICRKLIVQ